MQNHLFSASTSGDLVQVKNFLQLNDIEVKDFYGNTSLSLSVRNGHKSIAAFLITSGANVNTRNYASQTPLHVASSHGNYDCVELLLTNKADPNCCDKYGRTPLMLSVINNYPEIVKLLLEHRADPKIKDIYNKSSICRTRDINIITLLQNHSSKGSKLHKSKSLTTVSALFSRINFSEWSKGKFGKSINERSKEKVNELKNSFYSKNEELMKQAVLSEVQKASDLLKKNIIRWTKAYSLDLDEELKRKVEEVKEYKLPCIDVKEMCRKSLGEIKGSKSDIWDNIEVTFRKSTRKAIEDLIFEAKQNIVNKTKVLLREKFKSISYEIPNSSFLNSNYKNKQ